MLNKKSDIEKRYEKVKMKIMSTFSSVQKILLELKVITYVDFSIQYLGFTVFPSPLVVVNQLILHY